MDIEKYKLILIDQILLESQTHEPDSLYVTGLKLLVVSDMGYYSKAVDVLKMAAGEGFVGAMTCLGEFYAWEDGGGLMDVAMEWYGNAAVHGDVNAAFWLCLCYDSGFIPGKINKSKAFYWGQKAAELGHPTAQGWYGKHLLKTDPVEAVQWLRKAIDQEDRDAMLELGIFYLKGNNACFDDVDEGVKLLEMAVNRNHSRACHNAGFIYESGNGLSLMPIPRIAFQYYAKGALEWCPICMAKMFQYYRDGISVEKNLKEANFWLYRGYETGVNWARVEVNKLAAAKITTTANILALIKFDHDARLLG